MVTTGHQNMPKMGQISIISSFFARRAKKASAEGQSPPQELEVGPRSGPYLLVFLKGLISGQGLIKGTYLAALNLLPGPNWQFLGYL